MQRQKAHPCTPPTHPCPPSSPASTVVESRPYHCFSAEKYMASSSSSFRYRTGQLDTERISGSGEGKECWGCWGCWGCRLWAWWGACGGSCARVHCGEAGTMLRRERHRLLLLANEPVGLAMVPKRKHKHTRARETGAASGPAAGLPPPPPHRRSAVPTATAAQP